MKSLSHSCMEHNFFIRREQLQGHYGPSKQNLDPRSKLAWRRLILARQQKRAHVHQAIEVHQQKKSARAQLHESNCAHIHIRKDTLILCLRKDTRTLAHFITFVYSLSAPWRVYLHTKFSDSWDFIWFFTAFVYSLCSVQRSINAHAQQQSRVHGLTKMDKSLMDIS